MEQILDSVKHLEATSLERGHDVLRQGERKRQLYVLAKGSVEILKNGQRLCEISEPGSVFGELSVLLKTFHFATVRTLEPSSFYIVDDADTFLAGNPALGLHIARILASRLAKLDSYFADLKREFAELSEKFEQPTSEDSQKFSLLTQFLKKAEIGIEERTTGMADSGSSEDA
ncbi:MAG: CRP/FNR family cyclic AMP-dependent transcriptional regulator [Limisphaerales bacterium]|jgi:CRP/FNR family cyclic AMP-dependent transcriptional regulator